MVNSILIKCSMFQFLQSRLLCHIQYTLFFLPIFSVRFSMPQIFKLCWLFVKFSVPLFLQSCLLSFKFGIPRSYQSCSVLNCVCQFPPVLLAVCQIHYASFPPVLPTLSHSLCVSFSSLALCQIECASFPPVVLAVFKFSML